MQIAQRERKGFALPFVLFLLVAATLTIGASLERESTQRLAVERALLAYRRHHEAFGVRAIVQKWLGRMGSNRRLMNLAENAKGAPVFRFEMPGGTKIAVYLSDGQGLALEDIASLLGPQFDLYASILQRIPYERVDLVRTVGPAEISIRSAPREIFEALVEDPARASRFATAALAARRRDQLTPSELSRLLRRFADMGDQAEQVAALFTANPSLWRINVVAKDEAGERQFDSFVEIVDGDPFVRRWIEVLPGASQRESTNTGKPDRP